MKRDLYDLYEERMYIIENNYLNKYTRKAHL